jgi:GT2 family glycosyltransferase
MKEVAIITVGYITTDKHFGLVKNTLNQLTKLGAGKMIGVVNKIDNPEWLEFYKSKHDIIIENDKNNLSRAWNKGIKKAIAEGYEYFYMPNLDILLAEGALSNLVAFAKQYPLYGLYAMKYYELFGLTLSVDKVDYDPILRDNHNFSSYLMSKKTFLEVGEFDEQFDPAYCEDDDYLWRCKLKGITPQQFNGAGFWHYTQGTMKNAGQEYQQYYMNYLAENRRLYTLKWGGLPGMEVFKLPYNGAKR